MKIKMRSVQASKEFEKKYHLVLHNEDKQKLGYVSVDFLLKRIVVRMNEEVDEDERNAILKYLFYNFCVLKRIRNKEERDSKVYNYLYIENSKAYKSLIEVLMDSQKVDFDSSKDQEELLFEIQRAYKMVEEGIFSGKDEIKLNDMPAMLYGRRKILLYEEILRDYLVKKGYNGSLTEHTDHYSGFVAYYSYYSLYYYLTYSKNNR